MAYLKDCPNPTTRQWDEKLARQQEQQAAQMMNAGLGYQGVKSEANLVRERTVDALSAAVSRLRGAFSDMHDLANELCGYPPPEPIGQAIRGEPSGMFEAVAYAANDIDSITAEIAGEINRIRSRM